MSIRSLDWPLVGMAVILVAALTKAAIGVGVIVAEPSILGRINLAGIPRWQPAALSGWLMVASIRTWIAAGHFAALSVLWGLAAAAFARPALSEAGLSVPPVELLLIPWTAVLLWYCRQVYGIAHPVVRRSLAWTGIVVMGVAVAMWTPHQAAAMPAVAAFCYAAIAGASALTSKTSTRIRRSA